MSDEAYAAKLRAEGHVDELARISSRGKYTIPDRDRKHGEMASDGWNYRTAYFEDSNGDYYQLKISVANNGEKAVVYNVNQIKQMEKPRISSGAAVKNTGNALYGSKAHAEKDEVYSLSLPSNGGEVNTGAEEKITALSNDLGVATVFDDTLPQSVNGYYDTQTGEIHINPNADVNTVFSHELAHSLENTSAYQKLKDLVLNELGDEAETLRQQKSRLVRWIKNGHLFRYTQYQNRCPTVVRETGLEPVRRRHTHLKRACLPVPALAHNQR